MKFTSLALLAIVGGVSAGKPQLSVRLFSNRSKTMLAQPTFAVASLRMKFGSLKLL
jgi:hypothetical protein